MARRRVRRVQRQPNRLLQQASDETTLRYGGEIRGLQQLLRESRANLRVNINAEKGAAAGIQAATKAALPEIRQTYQRAGQSAQAADADVQRALAGLGSGADSTRAVAATESAAAKERLQEAMARTEADLGKRQIEAASGGAYGIRAAQGKYQQDVEKIHGQQQDLQKEIGTYLSSTYSGLQNAQAKLNLDKRRIRVSIGNLKARRAHDVVTEGQGQQRLSQSQQRLNEQHRHNVQQENKPSGRGGSGPSALTPTQARKAREDWGKGLAILNDVKPKRSEHARSLDELVKRGIPASIAEGVLQRYYLGGVRAPVRRRLRRTYGLNPRPVPHGQSILGGIQHTVDRLLG